MKDLGPPHYIETRAQLDGWVERCAGADIIAVDTESDSFHHYREKVCLIQMTAHGEDAIIDPLALDSLEPLRELFEDPRRVKIFHDACYDLVCLRRDFGFKIAGLFDTMVASRLLGLRNFGLAAILREHFGFEADKRLQRSDWARRPLSAEQLSYARFDTHFLPRLMNIFVKQLREIGRWEWAAEDFSRLPEVAGRISPRVAGPDPEGFWRVKGIRNFSPEVLGRVRALYLAREQLAARLDRPPFKIFGDEVLVELAQKPPHGPGDLKPRPGLRRAGVERFGKEIIEALAGAQPVQGKAPPGMARRRRTGRFLDPEARRRYEELRQLRRMVADGIGLEPEVALGNAVLEELARRPRVSVKELEQHPELTGWRAKHFVGPIHELLSAGRPAGSAPREPANPPKGDPKAVF